MMKIIRNDEHEPLASFELEDDGTITSTYVAPGLKDYIENVGILYQGKVYFPRDGADFLKALDADYSRSSRAYVQTVE